MTSYVGWEAELKIGANVLSIARDVTLNLSAGDIDDTDRSTEGWRSRRMGLKEWGVDVEVIYDPANLAWIALRDAFVNGTSLATVTVHDTTGGVGVTGTFYVTNFTRGEPLEDVLTTSVTLVGNGKPTDVWGSTA